MASRRKGPGPALLEASGLTIVRGGVRILDRVSWEVRQGEHWAILGANGSGKTSLLRALAGYFTPTEGGIRLWDSRYGRADWREVRRSIGLVSSSLGDMIPGDEPALATVASGAGATIDYRARPPARDLARARDLLRQVESGRLERRIWSCLSQGERQRVLIGRALMGEPPLLILDEPCAGLDPAARETFLRFLDRLARSARAPALVLVTHHVEELVGAFTHVLMLRQGKVMASGPRAQVMNSRNLARLFGARARLEESGGRYLLSIRARPSVA